MPVFEAYSLTLEVPERDTGIAFYSAAGLEPVAGVGFAGMRCVGQQHSSILLIGGMRSKRLHHVSKKIDIPNSGIWNIYGAQAAGPAGAIQARR
jgi:hypothetical protein